MQYYNIIRNKSILFIIINYIVTIKYVYLILDFNINWIFNHSKLVNMYYLLFTI